MQNTKYDFHNRIKNFALSAKGANQKVANFLLEHDQDAAFMTVEDIAKCADVSPGTVSRAAKAMGFMGFTDIQEQIRQVIRSNIAPAARMEKAGRGGVDWEQSVKLDIENLRSLLTANPIFNMKKAVHLLTKAPKIHIMGTRSSFCMAYFLAFNLGQIREQVFLLEAKPGQTFDAINNIHQEDVFVAIALPRYTKETVLMTEAAHKNGCRILSITDSHFSPLAKLATISLLTPYESLSFFNSYAASFALANILISQIAVSMKAKSKKSLEKLNLLHEEYQTFYNEHN